MSAIGSTAGSAVSRAALRADLARYQHKLSDCVNCSSAKTPEGKRNIQDLDTKIGALKAELNEAASSATHTRIDVYA